MSAFTDAELDEAAFAYAKIHGWFFWGWLRRAPGRSLICHPGSSVYQPPFSVIRAAWSCPSGFAGKELNLDHGSHRAYVYAAEAAYHDELTDRGGDFNVFLSHSVGRIERVVRRSP